MDIRSQERIVARRNAHAGNHQRAFRAHFPRRPVQSDPPQRGDFRGAGDGHQYSEFVRNLVVPTNLNMVHMNPLRGTALFVFDHESGVPGGR